jgi:hypothetical protein
MPVLNSPYHIVNSISQHKQSVIQLAALTTNTSNTQFLLHIDPLIINETLTHRGLSNHSPNPGLTVLSSVFLTQIVWRISPRKVYRCHGLIN